MHQQKTRRLPGALLSMLLVFCFTGCVQAKQGQSHILPDTLEMTAAELLEAARKYLPQSPNVALHLALAARRKAGWDGDLALQFKVRKLEGDALQYTGQYAEALSVYLALLSVLPAGNQKDHRSHLLKELGNVNAYMGSYDQALECYQEALSIAIELGDETVTAKLNNNIGLLYYRLGDYAKAKGYYEKTLAISHRLNDPVVEASTYTNLGFLLSRQGNHSKALSYQQTAFRLYEEAGDHLRQTNAYINIGLEYEFLDSLPQAIAHFNKARQEALASGHQVVGIDALNKLGAVYIKTGQYDQAREVLQEAYTMANALNDPALRNEINLKLSDYYKAVGLYGLALQYFEQWSVLKDSIINQDNLKRISELEVRHKTARQKQEIQILEQQNARQRLVILFTLITALLLGASGVLLWSRYQIRGRLLQNERLLQLQEKRRLALEAENEKQRFEKLKIEQQLREEENKRLQNELQLKNSELSTVAMLLYQKNERLAGLQKAIDDIKRPQADLGDTLKQLKQQIRLGIRLDEDWAYFKQHFEQVHPEFFSRLGQQFPNLTPYDHRHCAYIKMNLSTKEISRLFNINPSSVQRSRVRLKKKLGLSKTVDLLAFIRDF